MAAFVEPIENVPDNFLLKLNKYKSDILKLFDQLANTLNEKKQLTLIELTQVQERYEQSQITTEETAIHELEKNKATVLQSLAKVNNLVYQSTTDSIRKNLDVDIGVWRAKREELSDITVDMDVTCINEAIQNLCPVSVVVSCDYQCRKNPFKIVGKTGIGEGEYNWPRGVAIDDSDTIYVADRNNKRIQVLSIEGSYLREFGSSVLSSPHSLWYWIIACISLIAEITP